MTESTAIRQEMSAAEYLLVDGLAAIHRVGRTDGRTWMTSAAAQGKPSRTVLAERGPLPIADVVRIAQTVAVTLDTLIGTRSFTATSGHTASIWTIARTHHGQHLPASTIHVACRHPPPM